MSNGEQKLESVGSAPDFEIYSVAGKGDKKRWSRIGAAWHKPQSEFIRCSLDALPVNGEMVLKVIDKNAPTEKQIDEDIPY